jgi:hypothetical protein
MGYAEKLHSILFADYLDSQGNTAASDKLDSKKLTDCFDQLQWLDWP